MRLPPVRWRPYEKTGLTIRRRLHDPACPLDYTVVREFKSQGGTDYVAMPMTCSSGQINCISWATDRAGGFTDCEIGGLTEVAEALAIIVELQSTRRIARHLMDTYVGHRTGERVLSGAITPRRRPDDLCGDLVLRSARIYRARRFVAARSADCNAQ